MLMLNQLTGFGAGAAGVFPSLVGFRAQNCALTVNSGGNGLWGAPKPAGLSDGDLIVSAVFMADTTGDVLASGKVGWSLVLNAATGGGRLMVFTAVNSAGLDDLDGSFSGNHHYQMAAVAYRRAALDVVGTVAGGATASSVTPTTDSIVVLGIFTGRAGTSSGEVISAPANFTEIIESVDALQASGSKINLMLCDRQQASAAATGSAAATVGSTADGAVLITLKSTG